VDFIRLLLNLVSLCVNLIIRLQTTTRRLPGQKQKFHFPSTHCQSMRRRWYWELRGTGTCLTQVLEWS